MALGTLATHGPQHGHQIRRTAEVTNVGAWGGVSPGALYRELRTMEAEGLVAAVRTEQVGRRPARTVYEITEEGLRELAIQRDQALSVPHKGTDPVGVALLFGGVADLDETITTMRAVRKQMAAALERISAERIRLLERGRMDEIGAAVMRRAELHMEAELRWHEEFKGLLDRLAAAPAEET
jgi:DNA-binding PadR family transcriptional regulator